MDIVIVTYSPDIKQPRTPILLQDLTLKKILKHTNGAVKLGNIEKN